MKCSSCGNELLDNVKFCTSCGAPVPPAPPAAVVTPPPVRSVSPVHPVSVPLPQENRPLSSLAYFGLRLLFSIPFVGFICLIVFSFDNGNINRRNFARSYWWNLLLGVIITILLVVLLLVTGLGLDSLSELNTLM